MNTVIAYDKFYINTLSIMVRYVSCTRKHDPNKSNIFHFSNHLPS